MNVCVRACTLNTSTAIHATYQHLLTGMALVIKHIMNAYQRKQNNVVLAVHICKKHCNHNTYMCTSVASVGTLVISVDVACRKQRGVKEIWLAFLKEIASGI